jgi:hypothetical protein
MEVVSVVNDLSIVKMQLVMEAGEYKTLVRVDGSIVKVKPKSNSKVAAVEAMDEYCERIGVVPVLYEDLTTTF